MEALAFYRELPLPVRLHTRLRAWTCPFARLVERLPREGRLLEVGCGHGLLANQAALERPGLAVLGVDPAPDKIRWALATVGERLNIAFRCERIGDIPEIGFDAIIVADVLYLVPRVDWLGFLGSCRTRLRPGGRLLLKEVDRTPRWKFYRCVLQEALSVRAFGLTLGDALAFASSGELVGLLEQAGFQDIAVTPLDRGYMTPHVLYEARRG